MVADGTRKQYQTRGKTNAMVETTLEEESFDDSPLCLTASTPVIEATPVCSTFPTPRTPATPPGLLGEVFNRRRSTPTTNCNLTSALTSNKSLVKSPVSSTDSVPSSTDSVPSQEQQSPPRVDAIINHAKVSPSPSPGHIPTSSSMDILDDISTQTLNDMLVCDTDTTSTGHNSPASDAVDILDNISTQTLNNMLDCEKDITTPQQRGNVQITTPTNSPSQSPSTNSPFVTPLRVPATEQSSPQASAIPEEVGGATSGEVPSPTTSKVKLVLKLPAPVTVDADAECTHGQEEEEISENPQEKVPQQSPRKRKATAKSGRNDKLKKKAKKQKKKEKQRKLNELSHNQCTISQQLIDFDLKLEALHCAFSKANLSSFMDNIVEKVKEIRAVVSAPAPAAASQPVSEQQHQDDAIDLDTLPPPPPEWGEEEEKWVKLENIVLSQQNEIDILNEQIDEKDDRIESLVSVVSSDEQEKRSLARLASSLGSYKALCAEKDDQISEYKELCSEKDGQISKYIAQSAEWDIHASKKGNELQYAEEEIIALKGDLQKQKDKFASLQNENLTLKREMHNLKAQLEEHQRPAKTSSRKPSRQDQENSTSATPMRDPDIVFIHDSIGNGITPGIMSKYNLSTTKIQAYTQDQARESINNIKGKPKAVVLHVGTNDIKNQVDADDIIKNYDSLIKQLNQRLPHSKIVLSNILPREDNQVFQRNVEYVNAAVNRKFATMNNIVTVRNSDIGKKLKKDDGIHVTDIGRSRLASHIKDSIVDVLKLV